MVEMHLPTTQDLPVEPRVLTYVMQIGLITLRRNHRFDKYPAVNRLATLPVPVVWRYAASVAGPSCDMSVGLLLVRPTCTDVSPGERSDRFGFGPGLLPFPTQRNTLPITAFSSFTDGLRPESEKP